MEAVSTQPEQLRPDYETERGKAMPSKNHALIQSRLLVALSIRYGNQYDFLSEVSLAMAEKWIVPDIAIYPQLTFDSLHDETRMAQMPLGVIEIMSSQTQEELVEKSNLFLRLVFNPIGWSIPCLRLFTSFIIQKRTGILLAER
ncbi:Uma2 family endonuclease [Larkinella knui]|nr:Uma2 family endonuclease [Larkinella knui]